MAVDRIKRVNELIRREIAGALFTVLDPDDVDLSAFTVTQVNTTRDLREAQVLISIRAPEAERPALLARVKRCRRELQAIVGRAVTLRFTPRLSFKLDTSVEHGDRVLDLISRLEQEEGLAPPPPSDAAPAADGPTREAPAAEDGAPGGEEAAP